MNSCLRGNHFSPENQTFNSSFISNSSSLSYYQAPAPSAPKTKTSSSSHTPFFIKAMECTTSQKINKEGTVYDLALQRLRGVHSEVMFFLNNEPSFYENVNNDQLVVKVFNRETFEEQGMKAVEKNLLRYSLNQYEQLSIDYADLPETQKPFAVLYNSETAPENAYIVQEKVAPFQAPLWNINTHINDLSEENKSILDQIKDLFHYSYLLEDKPGLDLKWANIGIRPRSNTVVIFDYYEYDDQFYILAKPFLADLSQSSPSIRNYILEGLLEKCEQTQTSFLSDRYQELTNNNT